MTNRAPATEPSGRVALVAVIVPPWAATIWREIDRPSPEWVPNLSPAGRAL
jgi:hypothetical protein